MKLPIFQVDAFTATVFAGNPAAVVPLPTWLPDATLQSIARENNLSETAFVVRDGEDHALRWFTPAVEVPLCGHATLAAAWVVLNRLDRGRDQVRFTTAHHGVLTVNVDRQYLDLDLPRHPPIACEPEPRVGAALGAAPDELLFAHDNWLAVYPDAETVRALRPDFRRLAEVADHGVIATAPEAWPEVRCHFVSRFFAPACGVDEDPVTGSAHCALVPYWAQRLGRPSLVAWQVSARGGELLCSDDAARGRVRVAGQAVLYLEGTIEVPGPDQSQGSS